MTSYLLVAFGGAVGSIARYTLSTRIMVVERKHLPGGADFPYATLTINLIGSFLLGVVFTSGWNGELYALLAEGFLGAFTTFSTFSYEGLSLLLSKKGFMAFIYIAGSILLGVLCFLWGAALI